MKLVAIIILYNKDINESISYQKLYPQLTKKDTLIVYDNSTKKFKNEVQKDVMYISNNNNDGLSKAYNNIINVCKDFDYDYAVLFDDDTNIDDNFIKTLKEHHDNYELMDINYAKVYNKEKKLLAPDFHHPNQAYELFIRKNQLLHNTNYYKKNSIGINSGMIIKKDIFNNYHYNEDIFLDCVDWNFIKESKLNNASFFVTNCLVIQSFHSEKMTDDSINGLVKRCEIRINDLSVYAPKYRLRNKLFVIMLYVIKTKKLVFFKKL